VLKLGILASGRGSNFQSIIDAVENGSLNAQIAVLIVDKKDAFARERAKKHNIEDIWLDPKGSANQSVYFELIRDALLARNVQLVILAGFMRIVQKPLLEAYPNRIMNIHPSLLPAFPGLHAQRQAIQYGVKVSGCTVHFVDEGTDTGPIIIQAAVAVAPDDTEETLAERILREEHRIYPEAIRLYSEGRLTIQQRTVKTVNSVVPQTGLINPPVHN